MWRLLLIVGAGLLAVYRVRSLRKRGAPVPAALGVGLDRRPFVNLTVGAMIGAVAMSAIFLVEYSGGMLSITRVGPAAALVRDLLTFVAVPLTEELVFRCAILGALLLIV
ncbi:MAG: hypothetical protein ACXVJK_05925, partial [Candidatus Aminicenantales bacterium]